MQNRIWIYWCNWCNRCNYIRPYIHEIQNTHTHAFIYRIESWFIDVIDVIDVINITLYIHQIQNANESNKVVGERSGKEKKKSWVQANDESQYLSKLSWRMSGEWVVERVIEMYVWEEWLTCMLLMMINICHFWINQVNN